MRMHCPCITLFCTAPAALQAGVLPFGEAIVSISTTIVALCLNTGGLAKVRSRRILHAYLPIFTTSK